MGTRATVMTATCGAFGSVEIEDFALTDVKVQDNATGGGGKNWKPFTLFDGTCMKITMHLQALTCPWWSREVHMGNIG